MNGIIDIQDPEDAYTFNVNDQRLNIYMGGGVPDKKVPLILAES